MKTKYNKRKYCCHCKHFQEYTDNIENSLCTHKVSIKNNYKMLICDYVEPEYYKCFEMRLSICGCEGRHYEENN